MTREVDSLYICPWSLRDPLCRSQSLAYIRGLVEADYKFALITFETENYRADQAKWENTRDSLRSEGIYWYPVNWPAGTSISKKLEGIRSVVATGISVCRRHRPRLIHSRTSLSVFAAVTLSKLFRTKFLYDADSMLSEEYVDVGHVSRNSRAYKFLAWSEKWARKNADHIIVLTERLKDVYLKDFRVTVPVDVIPCCVDTDIFKFDPEARERLRKDLGANDDLLFVYVGKVGSWYLVDETFEFFRRYRLENERVKLLIVTQSDRSEFDQIAQKVGMKDSDYYVRRASADQVSGWLSAADAGLSLIRQVPSKQGSSPVKLAEYLACGLPVVITDLIGDCTSVVRENNVGVVLARPDETDIAIAVTELHDLLTLDFTGLGSRCRSTAESVFSVDSAATPNYSRIYNRLLGAPHGNTLGYCDV